MKTLFLDCNDQLAPVWQRVLRADDPPIDVNRKPFERAALDVRDQITEPIDAQHATDDGGGGGLRLRDLEMMERAHRLPERRQIEPLRQPGGSRREAVPSFERPAYRRPPVAAVGQLHDARRRLFLHGGRQHAVVRRDEPVVADLDRKSVV